MVWADLTPASWQIVYTYSDDQGQNWTAGNVLTVADEGPRCWPPHIAVGPGGDVYVAYHSQTGFLEPSLRVPDGVSGQIVLHHSANGGVNFNPRTFPYPPGLADMTWNVQHLANGVIPGATFWLQGSSQPWILPDPIVNGRVFVVANDDPDNNVDVGDAADVFIVTSNDFGANWSAPTRVDSGIAGSFQVMPTAAIDNITGAIAVSYYDNRTFTDADSDGNFELDLIATYSFDAGVTWQPEVDVNDGLLDPQLSNSCRFCCCGPGDPCCGQPQTLRIGEYNGIAYGACIAHFVWADNACSGGALDTWYDRDEEGGGDLTPPDITCPAHIQIGCNDPTDPSFTGEATATDNCDPNPDIVFVDVNLPGNCPPGTTIGTIQRTWSATDAAGNIDTCVQNISIVDADPPVITVPDPIIVECNSPGGVSINDPQIQAWLAQASAVDECSDTTLTNNAPQLFPVGCNGGQTTVVIFTGTDECGNSDFALSSVTVVDTTPPAVSCSVQITSLWSPNHAMIDVGWTSQVTDACDSNPTMVITVTSDEDPMAASGAGGGIHCPDAIINADGSILLRVERSGGGDGRVYRITITATDSCGNVGVCSKDVLVPQHVGQTRIDSGQNYNATICIPQN